MIIDEENNNIFIIEKLNSLKNELNRDQVNLKSVQRDIKQLANYDNTANYEYLNSLLDPKNQKGVKIPGKIPIPSCSFQLHNFATFRANENGYDVFTCNPWFLANEGLQGKQVQIGEDETFYLAGSVSPYFFCRLDAVDGKTVTDYWSSATTFTFTIPPVYAKYRLVSACATLRYTGELDQVKGIMGAAITYNKSNNIAFGYGNSLDNYAYGSLTQAFNDYGNFELIRDSFYSQDASCIEGLKILYFPLDNSFNEFKPVYDGSKTKWSMIPDVGPVATVSEDFYKPGFNWMFYLQGCPYDGSKRVFRMDFYMNYECIPKAEFLNYMPVTLDVRPCLTNDLKKKFMEEVQDKAIQKINIY